MLPLSCGVAMVFNSILSFSDQVQSSFALPLYYHISHRMRSYCDSLAPSALISSLSGCWHYRFTSMTWGQYETKVLVRFADLSICLSLKLPYTWVFFSAENHLQRVRSELERTELDLGQASKEQQRLRSTENEKQIVRENLIEKSKNVLKIFYLSVSLKIQK